MLTTYQTFFLLAVTAATGPAASQTNSQDLFANPGFESGNTGFGSDYSYSSGGNCCEGQYTVRAKPNTFNGAFVNPPPSSAGSVKMMVINGSTKAGQKVWYQNVTVAGGTSYHLRMAGCTAVAGGPAILQWQVNGKLIGKSVSLPKTTRQWVSITADWTPTASGTVQVVVRNLNISRFPNDFYLDDMSMAVCLNTASRASYGKGWRGRLGIPTLTASANPVSGTSITLHGSSSSGLATSQGLLCVGLSKVSVPLLGGTLLTSFELLINVPVPSTGMSLQVPIPHAPTLCGVPLYLQLLQLDSAASQRVSFTSGVILTVGK